MTDPTDQDPGTQRVPATYRFATAIPGAVGYDVEKLDRALPETFEHDDHTVGLVLNGTDERKTFVVNSDESVMLPIYAGAVFVEIDGVPTVTMTPQGGEWWVDPFEGGAFGPDHPTDDVERFLVEALHARLIELGEELPELDELLGGGDGEPEVATDGGIDTTGAERGHDVYDVVIPTEREIVVDVTAESASKAKVKAKAEAEYDDDEILRGTGRAWSRSDVDDGYAVIVKVGRELEATVEAPHPQKARTKAKYGVEYRDGEVIAAAPQVSRAPPEGHNVNGE